VEIEQGCFGRDLIAAYLPNSAIFEDENQGD